MPAAQPWPAPLARGPVRATVAVPGSKSQTNRALVLAALADGPSTITSGLKARDTKLMIEGLRSLGTTITTSGDQWQVEPGPLHGPAHIDCGLAGTVMRFLPTVAALAAGDIRFDGDPRARMRPMGSMVAALEGLGVTVDDDGRNSLPFTVRGNGSVRGGVVTIDASASSQYVSSLLLGAARFDDGLELRHLGPPIPSLPHVDMTVAMLRESSVPVAATTDNAADAWWQVRPAPIRAVNRTIEPDLSNAAPFLAAAMVTGGRVTIPGWPAHTSQAGAQVVTIFTAMGASAEFTGEGLVLAGPDRIRGLEVNLRDVGELTPVVAAVAALADGPSRLTGIGHLRGHETDRLEALSTELNRLGASVLATDDELAITPGVLHGTDVETYEDHRMAMAAAVLGLRVPGLRIIDVDTTRKTLPRFTTLWQELLGADQ